MQIVLATSNKNKVREINEIVQNTNIQFILPQGEFDPIENGATFEENSLIKAQVAWDITHAWVLADDSGLCIDALNGAPGIFSARYEQTPQKRIDRVLTEMQDKTDRNAEFRCAMTLINPQGEVAIQYTGICKGTIAKQSYGTNGFGYDPIFLLQNSQKTMAELSEQEKNTVSHRAKALNQIIAYLENLA